jgi:cysteine desulfurase
MPRVYFDNAATTPMSAVALQAFIEQSRQLGNPSSLHTFGRNARKDLEEARERLAELVGAHSTEIIFTGSGTEANNLALKGIYWQRKSADPRKKVIVISAFEHHAVLDPANWLREFSDAEILTLPVTREGFVELKSLEEILTNRSEEIALISVMHANNEVGTIQPIAQIAQMAKQYEIPVHTDAVQSFGKTELNFKELDVFAMTLSAHKLGGPVGVGALILKKGVDITPILHGGGQERDIRSGTLNAAGIVSFVAAAQSAIRDMNSNAQKVGALRERLIAAIQEQIPDAELNGVLEGAVLPGIANIAFPNTESDALLVLFDAEGIACSTGSACSAGVQEASHVLLAMGRSEKEARASLRFSLGTANSEADIEYLRTCIKRVIERARAAYSVSK